MKKNPFTIIICSYKSPKVNIPVNLIPFIFLSYYLPCYQIYFSPPITRKNTRWTTKCGKLVRIIYNGKCFTTGIGALSDSSRAPFVLITTAR